MIVVGRPGSRRVWAFQEALAKRGLPAARVVAWGDVIGGFSLLAPLSPSRGRGAGGEGVRQAPGETIATSLTPYHPPSPPAPLPLEGERGAREEHPLTIRLESPGQDFEVEKLLLAAGAAEPETEDVGASFLPADGVRRLEFDHGRLLYPRQWYRGFRATLRRLSRETPGVRWTSHPGEIAPMFDKRTCHESHRAAGVPVPHGLGSPRSFDELLSAMRDSGRPSVFVKLACGSSASGVIAFRIAGRRMQATTTVEMVRAGGRLLLYNSRRLQRHERPAEIEPLLNAICREGVQVEEWLPKATYEGRTFDMRVLVIGGKAAHVVPRLGDLPMTNLHLLNDRADPERVRAEVPGEQWLAAMASCERAARLYPGCLHVGVDVMFTPSYRRHAVLEVNAFGDFLPGATWRGMTTHEAELEETLPRPAQS